MGNTSQSRKTQQKYSYFHVHEDPHFGPCSIYQDKTNLNLFVVSLSQVLSHDSVSNVERNLKSLLGQGIGGEIKTPFLSIFDFSIQGNQENVGNNIVSTCQMPSVTFWVEFLRHNLKEFLQWRKSEKRPLSINEIIMALLKAIKAYEMTQTNQIFGPSLKLQDISVSIEGQMKFHPLLGKQFFTKSTKMENRGHKSCQSSPLRQRILSKRAFRQQKQNLNPKFLTSKQIRFLSPYLSKDSEFLGKLKKFAEQMIIKSGHQLNQVKNPEDSQFDEGKSVKRFLNEFQRIKGLSQAKNFLGQAKMDRFYVDFAKLKHEQSEAKFSKILSEIQQRSQKTDYSYHEPFNYVSPFKTHSPGNLQFFSPQHYHYS